MRIEVGEQQELHTRKRRPRVAVVQDGARGHYGVPIALARAGIVERVYTDWFVTPGSWRQLASSLVARFDPALGQRMLDRRCPELDSARIRQSTLLMLRHQLSRRYLSQLALYQFVNLSTGEWILRQGLGRANALMGFVRSISPRLCAECQTHGILTVADQMIAPAAIERDELRIQQNRWPGWQDQERLHDLEHVDQLERRTWNVLDHITCPSEYVKLGLLAQGIPPERVSVIHYPIDDSAFPFMDRSNRDATTVTIGFVGGVGLRKGAPYFLEVARVLATARVRFVMAGPVYLAPEKLAPYRDKVQLLGAVPRSQIPQLLRSFDMIFFPTTCEGSAYALMEAMSTGLPIVTSPNSGTIARHGIEGFLAPYDDLEAHISHLQRLIADRELRLFMGRAARRRYESVNLDSYSRCLKQLFDSLLNPHARR